MAQLGEYHRRRILVTFQRIDESLNQSLHALERAQSSSQPSHIQGVSHSKFVRIENCIKLIREQMHSLLERLDILLPERSTPSNWIIKTNLTAVDIALEDLHPKKLRGYGDMDSAAAGELAQTLQEIRKLVSQLLNMLE